MNNFKILIVLLFVAVAFFSCKKDTKSSEPVFTIASPTANKMYDLGDTVYIKGTITSTEEMHGYMVTLRDQTAEMILMEYDRHIDAATQTIDTFWVNNVTQHTEMLLSITAVKDHLGNTVTKEINFHCHPM